MAWRKKGKKNAPIVQMSDADVEAIEERAEEMAKSQLPLGRVKKVIRMNPDVEMLNSEALQMMAKAAEMFIKELSNAANQNAVMEKRKTLQAKDLDIAIKKSWNFAFLEDALDGWPKLEPKKRKNPNSSQDETVLEETIVEGTDEHNEEEEDDENVIEDSEDVGEKGDEQEEEDNLPETVPEFVEKEDDVDSQPASMKDPFAELF